MAALFLLESSFYFMPRKFTYTIFAIDIISRALYHLVTFLYHNEKHLGCYDQVVYLKAPARSYVFRVTGPSSFNHILFRYLRSGPDMQ